MKLERVCKGCGELIVIEVTQEQNDELAKPRSERKNIQDILLESDYTDDEREILISGFCGQCFDRMVVSLG